MVRSSTMLDVSFVGCTNFDSVTITVPSAGTIVVSSLVKLNVEHTLGTEDRWEILISDSSTICWSPPWTWLDEIPDGNPSESQTQMSAYLQRAFTVGAAGTYTYYVNGEMVSGESALDEHDWSNTIAVFYPS